MVFFESVVNKSEGIIYWMSLVFTELCLWMIQNWFPIHSSGLILPAKDVAAPAPVKKLPTPTKPSTASKTAADQMKNLDLGCKIVMGNLEVEETFKCTGQVSSY